MPRNAGSPGPRAFAREVNALVGVTTRLVAAERPDHHGEVEAAANNSLRAAAEMATTPGCLSRRSAEIAK